MRKLLTLAVLWTWYTMGVLAQSPATYNSSGAFTVPAGVTSIVVQAWGGGGAGGGSTPPGISLARGGGGGGGGAYADNTLTVTPGQVLAVVVAAQVNGVSGANGPNGNHSTITGFEPQIYASGGSGGTANTSNGSPAGGAGGVSSSPTAGSTTIAGVTGGNGATGLNISSGAGGAGANGGGIGGASVSGTGITAPGNPGTPPGGGGSGGRTSLFGGTAQAGGAGASGQVIITWTCTTYSISATAVIDPPSISNGNQATVKLTSGTLPSGTYTVNYIFSGGATDGSGTKTMTFTSGSPGVGTFVTSAITGYTSTTTITITNLSSGTAPGICSNSISSNNNAALPVTWLSFTTRLNDEKGVDLSWSTASESNNEGFDIERSTDGRDWQTIAFVPGAGTTSEIQTYSYTDQSPITNHQSLIYYRLKQTDFDGAFEYSPLRIVQLSGESAGIRVYPNPADEEVTISFGEPTEQKGLVQMYNQQGRLVLEQPIPPQTAEHQIRVSGLPAGMYVLRVTVGREQWSQRVAVE